MSSDHRSSEPSGAQLTLQVVRIVQCTLRASTHVCLQLTLHLGTFAAATAAAEAARLEAEGELLGDDLAVELDEFGRNTNLELKRELEQRATKRRKLLAVSQAQMHLVAAGDPFDAHDKDEADSSEIEEVRAFCDCSGSFNAESTVD